jgi:hypothetical protein
VRVIVDGVGLLAQVFERLPAATFVVDDDVCVLLANQAGREVARASPEELARWHRRAGELVECANALPEGCGRQEACEGCGIRGVVTEALRVGAAVRKTHVLVALRGLPALALRVAAAPLTVAGERLAVLTVDPEG